MSQWASSSELQLRTEPNNYEHSVISLLSFASTVPAGDICMRYWYMYMCTKQVSFALQFYANVVSS